MADHFISYSAPMVRGLLDDRKTQTRRILSAGALRVWTGGLDHGGRYLKPDAGMFDAAMKNARDFRSIEGHLTWVADPAPHQVGAVMSQWMGKLRIAVGDRLWVKENITRFDKGSCDCHVWYRAGGNTDEFQQGYMANLNGSSDGEWVAKESPAGGDPYNVSSRFMPKWASRLTLIVTDVRVQRLQDITEEDALAESIVPHPSGHGFWVPGVEHPDPAFPWLSRPTAREMYAALWDTINGSGEWEKNPVVVAYTFTVVKENIERIAA